MKRYAFCIIFFGGFLIMAWWIAAQAITISSTRATDDGLKSSEFLHPVIARDGVPKQSRYEILNGVYPDLKGEILRFAQNDMQRARNDERIQLAAATTFSIQRIELYFENRRADTTVMRDFPDLKAFADVTFTGSGLLQGYWQVDGRILSYVNQNLTFGGRITIQTPKTPPVPTFDTGSHVVKFVITNPPAGMPLPSILYFVTAAEFKGSPVAIGLKSPSDKSLLEYGPVKFEWEKVSALSTYSIQFYEDPKSKPVFSLCTDNASYAFTEDDLKKIFSPGRKYYWIVTGCGSGDEIGESVIRWFKFKTGSKNTP